jgi:hypothetical protein
LLILAYLRGYILEAEPAQLRTSELVLSLVVLAVIAELGGEAMHMLESTFVQGLDITSDILLLEVFKSSCEICDVRAFFVLEPAADDIALDVLVVICLSVEVVAQGAS